MNKTYKKRPTKYHRERKEKNWLKGSFIVVFTLFSVSSVINSILTSKMVKIENIPTMYQVQEETTKEVAKNYKNGISSTTIEVKKSTLQLIKTKTPYFENEVQLWLASEQACKSVGLGEKCIADLMGIAYTETRSFNYRAQGDGNKSWGAFQIHLGYHPDIKKEQALDPYWAAQWTIKRMIAYGYLKDRDYAIMAHNGTPYTKATLGYLETVNKYISM